MATRKRAANAAKRASGVDETELEQPSAADRRAQAEASTPLEAIVAGGPHEDHEGGLTDSLVRTGARAPAPDSEELQEQRQADIKHGIVRAPSVRERQTALNAAILRQGGAAPGRNLRSAPAKGSRIVPVIATRLGQYPADGRLRAPGEAFDYVMGPDEEKLPSWMQDATGETESHDVGGDASGAATETLIAVRPDGTARVAGTRAARGSADVL
jgi:hypothetical protein